ncbi:MFS transporter, partial [Gordonia aichiensis]
MTQTPDAQSPESTASEDTPRSGIRSFVAAIAAFAVVMLGTTLPTPLYSIYATDLGFGVTTT